MKTVSVILPNYNHKHLFEKCFAALEGQSVKPCQILIVDDCSTDGSRELLMTMLGRVEAIMLGYNQGPTAASNEGLECVRGDYVYIGALDDEVLPGFFEESLAMLEEHPEAGMSCTVGEWRNSSTGARWLVGRGRSGYVPPEEAGSHFIPTHTAIYRTDRRPSMKGSLKQFADWWLAYSTACRTGVCVVPKPLARFNLSSGTYYQRSRHQIPVIAREVLRLLALEENRDIADRVPVRYLGPEAFGVMRAAGRLTPGYLSHCAKVLLNRKLPGCVTRAYVGLGGKTL